MKYLLFILLTTFVSTDILANFNFSKDRSFNLFNKQKFSQHISSIIFQKNVWPEVVHLDGRDYEVTYNFNEKLSKYIKKLVKRYRPDYTSVVVIDNNHGKVLATVDYDKKARQFGHSLSFSSTNPAASVFKVVTAADLIESSDIDKETKFTYYGKGSTLYKYQLKDRKSKWNRTVPLKKAFAYSNNVVFGKAALKNLNDKSLETMATRFGFQKQLLQLVKLGSSQYMDAENNYSLAELASGFNKKTLISPMHGAVIASIIANNGVLRKPSVIDQIKDIEQGRLVWSPKYLVERSVSKSTAKELRDMMKLTVMRGTARGAFRPWRTRKISDIEIGGKTGSITGGLPFGKRDWFVAYAKPKDNPDDKGISICVMIVNVKKWYVKSTYLAKNIIQYYYDGLN
jgi:peptidoglycan glycosyltransferase